VPKVMVALPNIGLGGTLCSTPQSLADAHYYTVFQKKLDPLLLWSPYVIGRPLSLYIFIL